MHGCQARARANVLRDFTGAGFATALLACWIPATREDIDIDCDDNVTRGVSIADTSGQLGVYTAVASQPLVDVVTYWPTESAPKAAARRWW